MTQWNFLVSDDTDRAVRTHLAERGTEEQGLAQFVDEAVRQRVFWETVSAVRKRNADLSPVDAQRLADEALDWARANRS